MPDQPILCPVCSQAMVEAGQAQYYTRQAKFSTAMYHCAGCDIYFRDIENRQMVDHYYATSYVQLANEDAFREQRQAFFDRIIHLAGKHLPQTGCLSTQIWVDFGSAYGHLLEKVQEMGYQAIGIELNRDLVDHCTQRRLAVVSDFQELPAGQISVVTLIDSLYYVPDPANVLAEIKHRLDPGGIIVARVTNRNLYARLSRRLAGKQDLNLLGDATVSYSYKGLVKLFEKQGFKIVQMLPDTGAGKVQSRSTAIVYRLSGILTALLGNKIVFSPGMIVVARIAA